jgi:hypothetical protein
LCKRINQPACTFDKRSSLSSTTLKDDQVDDQVVLCLAVAFNDQPKASREKLDVFVSFEGFFTDTIQLDHRTDQGQHVTGSGFFLTLSRRKEGDHVSGAERVLSVAERLYESNLFRW